MQEARRDRVRGRDDDTAPPSDSRAAKSPGARACRALVSVETGFSILEPRVATGQRPRHPSQPSGNGVRRAVPLPLPSTSGRGTRSIFGSTRSFDEGEKWRHFSPSSEGGRSGATPPLVERSVGLRELDSTRNVPLALCPLRFALCGASGAPQRPLGRRTTLGYCYSAARTCPAHSVAIFAICAVFSSRRDAPSPARRAQRPFARAV